MKIKHFHPDLSFLKGASFNRNAFILGVFFRKKDVSYTRMDKLFYVCHILFYTMLHYLAKGTCLDQNKMHRAITIKQCRTLNTVDMVHVDVNCAIPPFT